MAKSFRFSPVKWRNPEHMPLIQLHLFTNLSPPLISLAFARQLPPGGSQGHFVPAGRQVGDPYRLKDFYIIPSNQTALLRQLREAPPTGTVETGGWRVARLATPTLQFYRQCVHIFLTHAIVLVIGEYSLTKPGNGGILLTVNKKLHI